MTWPLHLGQLWPLLLIPPTLLGVWLSLRFSSLFASQRRIVGAVRALLVIAVALTACLPVWIGHRAAVQCVGLATLGGLVGAGGLGAVVFEGMAQFAADLILLGALPIVAIALLADALLRGLEARAAAGRRRGAA